jgi:hypothetical protein
MLIDLAEKKQCASERLVGGAWGSISFGRLVEQLRKAGEISANETITHIRINVASGMIDYRVENI